MNTRAAFLYLFGFILIIMASSVSGAQIDHRVGRVLNSDQDAVEDVEVSFTIEGYIYINMTDSQGYAYFKIAANTSVDGIEYTAIKDDIGIRWVEGQNIPVFTEQNTDNSSSPIVWLSLIMAIVLVVIITVILILLKAKKAQMDKADSDLELQALMVEYDWDSRSREGLERYVLENELDIPNMKEMTDADLRATIDDIVSEQI